MSDERKASSDKELEDYTFDEVVSHCAWRLIEGLLRGEQIRSLVYQNCSFVAMWSGKVQDKQKRKESK